MAISAGTVGAAGPLTVSRARTSRRILIDRLASRLVVVGGIIVIVSILAILFVIVAEVYPLFRSPSSTALGTYRTPGEGSAAIPAPGDALGVDEYRVIAYTATDAGIALVRLDGQRAMDPIAVSGLGDG